MSKLVSHPTTATFKGSGQHSSAAYCLAQADVGHVIVGKLAIRVVLMFCIRCSESAWPRRWPRRPPVRVACIQAWLSVQGHTDAIATLAWSPDDSMLATCGQDRILRLWSSEDGRCIQELSHHTQQVSAVAWLPDSECWVPACSAPAQGADAAGLGCSTASADCRTASAGTAHAAGSQSPGAGRQPVLSASLHCTSKDCTRRSSFWPSDSGSSCIYYT